LHGHLPFHCTDSECLAVAQHGGRFSPAPESREHAAEALANVIENNPAVVAAGWFVCEFDEAGRQVDVLTLDELRADARPGSTGPLPRAA